MKKLTTLLVSAALSLTLAAPAFAAPIEMPVKVDGQWNAPTEMQQYGLSLGEQFASIPDEKERTIAVANYIKDNYVWDLNFVSDVEAMREGKTGHFGLLYRCMLTGAGIKVIGSTDTKIREPIFDITQTLAQDAVIEIDGVRYWSSPLVYKYYGEDYLLRTDIPSADWIGNPDYDLNMNILWDPNPVNEHEITGVPLGSCLDD